MVVLIFITHAIFMKIRIVHTLRADWLYIMHTLYLGKYRCGSSKSTTVVKPINRKCEREVWQRCGKGGQRDNFKLNDTGVYSLIIGMIMYYYYYYYYILFCMSHSLIICSATFILL